MRTGPLATTCLLAMTGLLLVSGCKSVRSGLGAYQKAADKGVELRVGTPPADGPEAPAQAAEARHGKTSLPSSLGGDSEARTYLPAQPPKE